MNNNDKEQPKVSEKKWLKFLLLAVGITMVLSMLVSVFLREEAPIQENTWNLVTPGFKFTKAAQDQLGQPVNVIKTELGTQYNYKTEYPIHNNTVTTSEDNTVTFVEEFITYDPQHTINQYTTEFGQPDLVLNAPLMGDIIEANVFLSKGVTVFTHKYAGTVTQKWYFEPMPEAEFLSGIGKNLSQEEHEPEVFQ